MNQEHPDISMIETQIASSLVTRYAGEVSSFDPLPSARNHLFRAELTDGRPLVIKLYATRVSLTGNSELAVYETLGDCPFIRNCLAYSKGNNDDPPFVLLEWADGKTLFDVLPTLSQSGGALQNAVGQVYDYVNECTKRKAFGFGTIKDGLKADSKSWLEFVQTFLDGTLPEVQKINEKERPFFERTFERLDAFLRRESMWFESREPCLTPVDLNLNNFLYTDDDRVLALDLETFWGADPLMALGEWTGHAYGTAHGAAFSGRWGILSDIERRVVRFYALLSNYSVLIYIVRNGLGSIAEARPWGNPARFVDLVNSHRLALDAESFPLLPERLWEQCQDLFSDWGIKKDVLRNIRSHDYDDLWEKLAPIKARAGITRVADITDLDATGIHVYQSVRPEAEQDDDTFTVFAGWGETRRECQVKAIAEGIERYCAEKGHFTGEIVADSYENLSKIESVVHPEAFNMPASAEFRDDEIVEWIETFDLVTGESWFVTANTVFYPYFPDHGRSLFRYFTTGLATSSLFSEAAVHGLAETIERDAAALNRILRNYPALDLDTIDSERAQTILRKLRGAGLDVIVRYISPPDIGIPVFSVILEDPDLEDALFVSGGYGAHPSKEVALCHGLNEAAQSRVGTISGAREDLVKYRKKQEIPYSEFKRRFAYWFDRSQTVDYRQLPTQELPTALDDLAWMCGKVQQAGFERILLVDLSHEELILPTVKVLVPGIERYSFKMRCVGRRAQRWYREQFGQDLVVPE